jgi:hypothetical protein
MANSDQAFLADLALVSGRLAGAWAMAPQTTRVAAAGRHLQAVWDTFLRDAGMGDVGPDHCVHAGGVLTSLDPRRDGVLLWLMNHAPPSLGEAATLAARAVGAARSLPAEDLELLAAAVDFLPPAPDYPTITEAESWLRAYAARLREDVRFAECVGQGYTLPLRDGRYHTWRASEPADCWAANLALQTRPLLVSAPIPPGILSRELLRLDLNPAERTAALHKSWVAGIRRAEAALFDVNRELARGESVLASLSKNARARDAWALVVSFGQISRPQLMRALDLSRAGAWFVAGQLAGADLVMVDRESRLTSVVPGREMGTDLLPSITQAAGEVDAAVAKLTGKHLMTRQSE